MQYNYRENTNYNNLPFNYETDKFIQTDRFTKSAYKKPSPPPPPLHFTLYVYVLMHSLLNQISLEKMRS